MPAAGNPQQWIAKAEQDYRTVVALSRLRVAPVPDSICFHAQQCAEKYLKALLGLKPLAVEVRYPGRSMTPTQAHLARQWMDTVRVVLRKTLGL